MAEPSSGKGRPTPKRSAARGQRRVPTGPPPRTRKEAAKRRQAEAKAKRAATRQGLRSGDVSKLPPQLADPERVFVRDVVDSRRCYGALLLPSIVVNLAAMIPVPVVRAVATTLWFGMFVFAITDSIQLGFRVRRALRARYATGTRNSARSLVLYGVSRATLPRRFRMPRPRVALGAEV